MHDDDGFSLSTGASSLNWACGKLSDCLHGSMGYQGTDGDRLDRTLKNSNSYSFFLEKNEWYYHCMNGSMIDAST